MKLNVFAAVLECRKRTRSGNHVRYAIPFQALVMMAFAVAVDAGYVPLLYNAPLAYSGHTTVIKGNQADPAKITEYPALAYDAPAYAPYFYPSYYAYHAPAPIAYSAPAVLLQKEARYLAANRGAIHEAPLPGHEISQQQLNL